MCSRLCHDLITPVGGKFTISLEYGKQFVLIAQRKNQTVKKLFINTDVPNSDNTFRVNLKLMLAEMSIADAKSGIMDYKSGKGKFSTRTITKAELKKVEQNYPDLYTYIK